MRTIAILLILSWLSIDVSAQTTFIRTYGGSSYEEATDMTRTADGGYVILGETSSFGAGTRDYFLVKANAFGALEWSKAYGGSGTDFAASVQQTFDGGYIITGETCSFGGQCDFLAIKTDPLGDTLWTRTYGGFGWQWGRCVQQTADSGYVFVGVSSWYGPGTFSMYVIRTDAMGDTLWARGYGGSSEDQAFAVIEHSDGGFIIGGYTKSFGAGNRDVYLIKTDNLGNLIWTKTYGGSGDEECRDLQLTSDGGVILTGYTDSYGAGSDDLLTIKTDSLGNVEWSRVHGGIEQDLGRSVWQTADNGYVVAGITRSYGGTDQDAYLIRLDSIGDTLWTKVYGNPYPWNDGIEGVEQTSDGGFILGAFGLSSGGPWGWWGDLALIKTDANGNSGCKQWSMNTTVGNPTLTVGVGGIMAIGCETTFPPILVTTASSGDTTRCGIMSLSVISNEVLCLVLCDESATVTAGGGFSPYTYLWDDSQTASTAINLCAGTYCVTVTDSTGVQDSICVTISDFPGFTLTTSPSDVSCFNACDGNATVSVSGGTAPSTYLWNDPSFQTTNVASNLCNGIYIVTVTDSNGCMDSASVGIFQPQQLGLASTSISSTCGFNNGSACVNVIGGCSPFVIQWDDPATTIGACALNLFAGTYNPIVSDCNGCTFTIPVIINNILGPTIDSIVTTPLMCFGDCNGMAQMYYSGGTPPFTYSWFDPSGPISSGSSIIFNLCAGDYGGTISDGNGCLSSDTFSISEPPLLVVAIVSVTDVSCSGVCDGSVTALAGGGTPPYTYVWASGGTSPTDSGLCAATHNVFVLDANGCFAIASTVISEPAPIIVTDSIIDVSCNGGADGAIYVNVTGGTPFYSYQWFPIGGPPFNLSAQTYSLLVTDINGCTYTGSYTVNEPAPLVVTANSLPSSCGNSNGQATVIPSGGTQPYYYVWDDLGFQTTATATGLIAGTYSVTVTDANNCTFVLAGIVVTDIPGPTVDSTTFNNSSCGGNCDGAASVFASGGTVPISYSWSDGQTSSSATGFCPGTYTITVTDLNGCTDSNSINIVGPAPVIVITSPDLSVCTGETVTITASAIGGTQPYFFTWDNGLGNNSVHTIVITQDTTFTVIVTDSNLCSSNAQTISISIVDPLTVVAIGSSTICTGDSVIISATPVGGAQPYSFIWDNGDSSQAIWVAPLVTATYNVTVTDSCGTTASSTAVINVNTCDTTGIAEFFLGSLSIYPNPNTGKFILDFNLLDKQDVLITLYSATGQIVYKQSLTQHQGPYQQSIEVLDQAVGIYTLRIVFEKGVVNRKLIIE